MKNPRRGEKARPCFDLVLKYLGLGGHEEPGVSTYLPEFGVAEAILDYTIDETQGDRVIFHFGAVQIVKPER